MDGWMDGWMDGLTQTLFPLWAPFVHILQRKSTNYALQFPISQHFHLILI
jgi:hypothetical protein